MGFFDVDASPTAWREFALKGDQRSPLVAVFLHGLGGSRLAWQPQGKALSSDRRIIAWDGPGVGTSDRIKSCTFDAYAQRAIALINEFSPDAPVDLVGTSFGGMIAQYASALAPQRIRSLTLISTSPKFGLDGTDPDEWRARRLAGLEEFGSTAAAAPAILTSLAGPKAQHVVPEAVEAMARVTMDGLMDALTTITHHDSQPILPTITVPTLALVGSDDDETPVAYSQAIVDLMPHARLQVIPDVGHLLNLEAPESVNLAIRQHWEETRS